MKIIELIVRKMAISTKALAIGLIIGLVIGGATGLFVKPKEVERVTETVLVSYDYTNVKKPEILSVKRLFHEGYFIIVGEVRNNLETNIKYVKIVATFYDVEYKVIGTSFTFTDLKILKPGQKSPFELSSFPEKIICDIYKLTLSYTETDEEPFKGLVILSHTASFDELGYHQVVGEVRNNGDRKSTYVKVICTYYGLLGMVIGKSFTFTDPNEIDVGETAPFKLSSFPNKISPASYELQVEGS